MFLLNTLDIRRVGDGIKGINRVTPTIDRD